MFVVWCIAIGLRPDVLRFDSLAGHSDMTGMNWLTIFCKLCSFTFLFFLQVHVYYGVVFLVVSTCRLTESSWNERSLERYLDIDSHSPDIREVAEGHYLEYFANAVWTANMVE